MGRTYDTRAHRGLLAQLMERDGGLCRDPQHPAHLDPTKKLTAGHIVHEVDGGPTDLANAFLQCRSCNAREAALRNSAARRRSSGPRQAGGSYVTPSPVVGGVGGSDQLGDGAAIPHVARKMPAFVSAIRRNDEG